MSKRQEVLATIPNRNNPDYSWYWDYNPTLDAIIQDVVFTDEISTDVSGITLANYYTKAQTNGNFLSATTDLGYTNAQINANFLSGNTFIPTDFYSKAQANANFVSALTLTSYSTTAQANANYSPHYIIYTPGSGDTSGAAGQVSIDSGVTYIRTNTHWKMITTTDI